MVDLERVRDIELIRTVAKIQDAELHRLNDIMRKERRYFAQKMGMSPEQVELELLKLEDEISETHQRIYGGGSERRPREARPEREEPKPPQKGHGPTPQPELKLEEHVHALDAADETCPSCGEHLEAWDGQFETHEEVDVVEVQYVVKKHKRQKYRCACGHIETALGPDKPILGGRYGLGFAAHVAVNKYADHLPLTRQVGRMKRVGLQVTSQSLWDQAVGLAVHIEPLLDRLHSYLLSKDVVQVDETRWPVLGSKARKKTKNWFVWSLAAEDAVLYKIQDGRSNEEGREILQDYKGVAVTDGYIVYDSLSKSNGFVLANCWSHARRKFIEAERAHPEEAGDIIDIMGSLFGIEREIDLRVASLPPWEALEVRKAMRQAESKPRVNALGEAVSKIKALKGSPLARAIQYLDNRWERLNVFLDDPRVPMTSNAVERSLRGPVLGRKNFQGSRSRRGTEIAALYYSLIESCRLNGLDPHRYLLETGRAAIREQELLLPHEFG